MVMGGGDGVGGMGAIAAAVIRTLGKELESSQVGVGLIRTEGEREGGDRYENRAITTFPWSW